jgi:hypothetical protein
MKLDSETKFWVERWRQLARSYCQLKDEHVRLLQKKNSPAATSEFEDSNPKVKQGGMSDVHCI